ncbi:DUF5719 family protein [Aquipuribacter sp. MA13-6]|uniref:DUF5719 family protein n=1 Tax=unclassified Aquipuribacter TaxID=2635084 RepID=UPI003EEC8A73
MSVDVQAPTGPGTPSGAGPRPVRVTAVLVVHDGAEWLPRTLAALAGSDRRPDLVVAVDAGSTDRSVVLLDTAVGSTPSHVVDAVVTGGPRDGFGVSVARALAVADNLLAEAGPSGSTDGATGPARRAEEWVWLLHDDSAPEPDALDELLGVVRASPTLAVAGCKQVGWDDPTRLVEVGATVSSGGRRLTDVAAGDIDQGQHDSRGDVLLVSTAGMLLRRSVLEHVGGFDDAIPLVGDDVDLCMRVRRAGHRVAVVPTARVRHVAALERGARPADALHGVLARRVGASAPRAGGRAGGLESARRRHWLHARLVQAPAPLLPLLWVWVLLAAPVRALVWLLRGRPGRALAELDAALRLVARGWRVASSRWRSRRSRVVPAAALRPLQRSRSQMLREDLDGWRARRSLRSEADPDESDDVPLEAVESGPVDEDLIDLDLGAGGPVRRLLAHPLTYLVPLTLLLGVVPVLRDLLRPVAVDTAGAEVVVADPTAGLTAVELGSRALSGWRDVGLGVVGAADPATVVWAGITAVVSLLTRLSPDGATLGDARDVVVLLAPLVGLLLSYPVLRRLVRSRAAAAAAATTWALLPWTGLLGPVHAGDLVVHVLLPVLLAALVGCLGPRPVRSAAAAGLLSAVVVALAPATWPVLVVVAVLAGVVGGSRCLARWRACLPLLAVATPALVWLSWLPSLRRDSRVLLLDPAGVDPTTTALPSAGELLRPAVPVTDLLRGQVSPADDLVGVLALLVLALLALAGGLGLLLCVAALARARVPAAWCALLAAATAAVVGVLAAATAAATDVPASVPASAAALALAVVVGLLVRDLHDPDRREPRHDVRARRVLAAGVRVAAPVVAASLVLGSLAVGALVDADPAGEGLPSPALVGAQSPQATRTLLLDAEGVDVVSATGVLDSVGRTVGTTGTGPVDDDVVSWAVTAGQPGPGQASVATTLARPDLPVRPGERLLADAVASLLGDGAVPGDEVAAQLARLGVGWVVVRGSADVDIALAQRAGLVRTSVESDRTTWRVDSATTGPVPSRARLVGADGEELGPLDLRGALGSVPTGTATSPAGTGGDPVAVQDDAAAAGGTVTVPDGDPGRVLVLADNARTGWRATADGAVLTTTTVDGWAQGFLLPAGPVEVELSAPMSPPSAITVSAAVVAVVLLLLLWPGRRPGRPLDGDRRPAPAAASRSGRALRRAGRTTTAVVGVSVTALLLLLATGTGSGPGPLQVDRQVRAALAATGAGQALGDRLAATVAGLPAAGDPAVVSPAVTLAAAGSVATCAAVGDEAEDVVPEAAAEGGAAVRGLTWRAETDGDRRGLRLSACPSTAPSSWALLGGTAVGQQATLLLTNPGETGAVVDVRVGGVDGPVETPSSTGLLVGPGGRTEVRLDALAPDLTAVLARVEARQGTVAVSATDTALVGLVPQGGDTQPAQVVPAAELVVPGVLVPSDGTARLLVGAVGDTPAVVRLRAVPADGGEPVDLTGPDLLVAPAGGVVEADLSGLAPGGWAVHVAADAPVVASATWTQQRAGEPAEGLTGVPVDRAWAQAVPAEPAWTTPVRVPLGALLEASAVPDATVSLVGRGDAAGEARLQVVDADGQELTSAPVVLPAGGAPVDVALVDLLDEVDPAAVEALVVRSATGVHIGVRASVADGDGPLTAGTSVPGAPPAPDVVRLVRR